MPVPIQSNVLATGKVRDDNVVHLRKSNKIDVCGEDIPAPVQTFEEMATRYKLPSILIENMKKAGYDKPTPIQMQAIPLMMERRELISAAPTGSGKTLAFLIPVLAQLKAPRHSGFRAVILAPTRELAKQIHREFLWIAEGTQLRIHIIKNVDLAIKKFAPGLKVKKDILITTPNRLVKLLTRNPPVISLNK